LSVVRFDSVARVNLVVISPTVVGLQLAGGVELTVIRLEFVSIVHLVVVVVDKLVVIFSTVVRLELAGGVELIVVRLESVNRVYLFGVDELAVRPKTVTVVIVK